MRVSASRNDPCPCGSGRKHKRCCLAADERAAREARFESAVGRRIHAWTSRVLDDEIGIALAQFAGDRVLDDDDLQVFATWFHNDHMLPDGHTPAERYAGRADLPAEERAAAARIASARLGLHRVLAVEPRRWLLLEDVLGGARARVASATVSREAVRWDLLLGRVMDGDPPGGMWGPVRFFEPCDEPELLAELERLAAVDGASADAATTAGPALRRALRAHALELLRFVPPSWSAEPSYFTPEGDPLAHGTATWHVDDPAAAGERLRELGGLAPGEPLEIDITARRETLVRDRPELPPGALVIEAGPIDDPDTIPIVGLRLEGTLLSAEAMSEPRLEHAIEIVEADFGDLAELLDRELVPIEQRMEERAAPRDGAGALHARPAGRMRRGGGPPAQRLPAAERRLLEGAMTERMRRWLDDPHPQLDGRTPREAARGEWRAEVVRLVRGLENGAERARRDGEPHADVSWIGDELGIADELRVADELAA